MRGSSSKGLALKVRLREEPEGGQETLPSVLATAPVNTARPGTSVNSSPLPVYSPPGPAGLGRRLQESVSKQYLEAAQGPLHINSAKWGRVGTAATWPFPAGPNL